MTRRLREANELHSTYIGTSRCVDLMMDSSDSMGKFVVMLVGITEKNLLIILFLPQ